MLLAEYMGMINVYYIVDVFVTQAYTVAFGVVLRMHAGKHTHTHTHTHRQADSVASLKKDVSEGRACELTG